MVVRCGNGEYSGARGVLVGGVLESGGRVCRGSGKGKFVEYERGDISVQFSRLFREGKGEESAQQSARGTSDSLNLTQDPLRTMLSFAYKTNQSQQLKLG